MFWGNENGVPKRPRGSENGVPKVPAGIPRRCGVSGFCWGFWVSAGLWFALVGLWWGLGGALVDATFNFNSNEVSIYGFYLFSICFVRV